VAATGTRTPAATGTPTGTSAATGTATAAATSATGGANAPIDLTAQDIKFSTDEITVQAGEPVVIEFTNQDALPHNFALYTDESAQEVIFRGELIVGPTKSIRYEFDAPDEPGTYFFRCDPHPLQMRGSFIVE
jgi:plastocyanin